MTPKKGQMKPKTIEDVIDGLSLLLDENGLDYDNVEAYLRTAIGELLEGLEMKKEYPAVGKWSYNQAVRQINKNIKEMKG